MGSLTKTTRIDKIIETIVSWVYNRVIVDMTEVWYRAVLERQRDGACILDIGVGNAGALLRCKDLIISKKLRIIGIDYNAFYIAAAHQSIQDAGPRIAECVHVHCCDLYDRNQVEKLLSAADAKIDVVYFSGSFSLLPDMVGALKMAASILVRGGWKDEGGRGEGGNNKKGKDGDGERSMDKVYITQTYQRRSPPFLSIIKPIIKYVTTIDFGQLVMEKEVLDIFKHESVAEVFEVEDHTVLEGSVDNYWQAAYISILKRKIR